MHPVLLEQPLAVWMELAQVQSDSYQSMHAQAAVVDTRHIGPLLLLRWASAVIFLDHGLLDGEILQPLVILCEHD